MLYKCTAKILVNRLKKCLPVIIGKNQSAFIEGKRIVDIIFLAQEIVNDYGKGIGKSRCTLKIDIMKLFNSVNWSFVLNILQVSYFLKPIFSGLKFVSPLQCILSRLVDVLQGPFLVRRD